MSQDHGSTTEADFRFLSFSTSKEIDRDVSMLHPDTLLCVPSVRNATDRKSPCERKHIEHRTSTGDELTLSLHYSVLYVTAQVMAMNAHLLQLDLATSGTRDRAARKTARETRDKFVAQQKKLVNARHRVSNFCPNLALLTDAHTPCISSGWSQAREVAARLQGAYREARSCGGRSC